MAWTKGEADQFGPMGRGGHGGRSGWAGAVGLVKGFGTGPLVAGLQAQRGHFLNWVPVFLGLGIGIFFALSWEPQPAFYVVLVLCALALGLVARRAAHGLGPLLAAAAVVLVGITLAGARTHWVAGPTVDFRYYGPITGRVVNIDRSASDKVRLTLDQVVLDDMAPWKTPRRVRVALHARDDAHRPAPGAIVMLTGHLSQAPGPAEPGGFDFQRHAWFLKLGAVGYTRSPVLAVAPPAQGPALAVFRLRMWLSDAMQAAVPGQAGALASAVTTGDRSGLTQKTIQNMRQSNLAHLLAISGLHMGLLTAFVFGLLRFGFALTPGLSLRAASKKFAAFGALLAGAFYLAMSGGSVATERAFVMVAVVLGAVIFDRRALTLRAVAVAAIIVLLLRPEALLSPGFQMSFAATTALVAVFGQLGRLEMEWMPRFLRPAVSVFVSSLVAGLATAPLAAAHFNIISHYGLIANLLAVPVMGTVVVPAAVFASLLAPLGLEAIALWVMEAGLAWILWVAATVAGLDGAVGRIASPGPIVLPLLALGGLFVVLWRGRMRYAGAVAAVAAFALWTGTERPAILISQSGGLVGWMTDNGRALSKPRGDRFAASVWLENDGDGRDQAAAFERAGGAPPQVGALKIVHVTGKAAQTAQCSKDQILVVNQDPAGELNCEVIGPRSLRDTGALAFTQRNGRWERRTAHDVSGQRIWNSRDLRRGFGVSTR